MIDGMKIRGWIVEVLSRSQDGKIIELTEDLFYKAFPEPKGTFSSIAFKNMLLVMNGNRPHETSEELLKFFCDSQGIEFRKNYDSNIGFRYYFRKKLK